MDASTKAKKIPILTKNPIIGGMPAMDNKTVLKNKAKILFCYLASASILSTYFINN